MWAFLKTNYSEIIKLLVYYDNVVDQCSHPPFIIIMGQHNDCLKHPMCLIKLRAVTEGFQDEK
jgi:hypothetical protein